MKNIKILSVLVACGFIFAACNDTKDCACEVEIPSKSTIKKLQRTVDFKDWDTDCSKITDEDLDDGQILNSPCKEI